jgi:hypothetical protein
MTLDALVAFLQSPAGATILSLVFTLIAAALHAIGVNVPGFSALVNLIVNAIKGQSTPAPTPAPAPLPASANPILDAIAAQLAKMHGLAANHPVIVAAAKAALADAPTLIAMLTKVAPLVPLVAVTPETAPQV